MHLLAVFMHTRQLRPPAAEHPSAPPSTETLPHLLHHKQNTHQRVEVAPSGRQSFVGHSYLYCGPPRLQRDRQLLLLLRLCLGSPVAAHWVRRLLPVRAGRTRTAAASWAGQLGLGLGLGLVRKLLAPAPLPGEQAWWGTTLGRIMLGSSWWLGCPARLPGMLCGAGLQPTLAIVSLQ